MKTKALIICLVMLIFLIPTTTIADDYISYPGRIPLMDNIVSPQIKPGESRTFRLTIENRYDDELTNVTLTADIFGCGTSYFYKDIEDVDSPPKINGKGQGDTIPVNSIQNGSLTYVNFTIKSYTETTQGTYFLRFQLDFKYNNSIYTMKSKGCFSDEEWENATIGATEENPGKIKIEALGVDGIIPDSSFKVWEPIPLWPLYVIIIPFSILLCVLALMFYAQEEYNMFPWLDQGFKYWSGKFHQSWRLLKHRFRKA